MFGRRFLAPALCVAGALAVGAAGRAAPEEKPACGGYGTTIDFMHSTKEAAKWAKKEGKLVFVLHVSGHFEDPRFT